MPRIPRFFRLPRSAMRIRADVDEEIRFDIEMRAEDLVRHGLHPEQALQRAIAEFGDVEATRSYCAALDADVERAERRSDAISGLRADVSLAWRRALRAPIFAGVVVATLALGIGANTAIFSVVRRVLIAPLPFAQPNQLFRLYTRAATNGDDDKLSAIELDAVASRSHSIAGLTRFGNYDGVTYVDAQSADSWATVAVAPNFFDVLGVRPIIGRTFSDRDFADGASSVILISHERWQSTFGGDPAIAGRVIQLSGKPATIIGVLPEHFVGPTFVADALRPLIAMNGQRSPQGQRQRVWRAIARLRSGVSLEQWRSELSGLQRQIAADHPDMKNAGFVIPKPLHEAMIGAAGSLLRLVMTSAAIVLLAACANIAGLFLARGAADRRELAVRAALGAGRPRLIRQMLVESLLYGVVGGVAGVALAAVLKTRLLREAAQLVPQLGPVRIDAAVLAFAFGIALACGVAFGLWPAIAATYLDAREVLGATAGRSASRGASAARASRMLVSTQLAFAVALVVGAGLLSRTVFTLMRADLGYETSKHQATFFLSMGRFPDLVSRGAYVREFLDRAHALPGVSAVGYTVTGPWSGSWRTVAFDVESRPDADEAATAFLATASHEFFRAAGIPIRAGRDFNDGDGIGTAPVVVISESMARRYWPGSNPVGARIHLLDLAHATPADTAELYEVVGVAKDVRADAASEVHPTIYVSAEQARIYGSTFVLRTTGDASALLPGLRRMTRTLDARVPLVSPRTLADVAASLRQRQDFAMRLLGFFAMLVAALAALGVYGVMTYAVSSRTREFGIRAALGATQGTIVRALLREAIAITSLGIVAGLAMAWALSRLVGALLVGISDHDIVTFAVTPLLLTIVALAACVLPCLAAARIEPVEALRSS